MSRIKKAFENGKAFIPFLTGGDPDIGITEKLIFEMEANGADLIEIGVPFSDPIAEGVVIQAADERALSGGVTTDDLFAMVKRVREKTQIPLVFMTYYNPVFSYGNEKFLANCKDCGIDGIIIPDLPFEESDEIRGTCKEYGIDLINMIAPTSEERIERIAKSAEGFLYCVSSLGVTGVRETITTNVTAMIEKVRSYSDIPCAIGFGISNPKQAKEMAAVSDGVIVGSAIVRIIAEHGKESAGPVGEYVKSMKEAANS
ncbi:MAG: tryptophan synthase subunit alpha [Lachnospiraceae bacterium]|nr:tryptophan synthase subunit alpha [Lachnospiraceae bacterium]